MFFNNNYSADRHLLKQVAQTASGGSTRLYIDNLYERDSAGSLTTHIHYIKAGGEIVALYKSKSNNSEETRYLHKDHLGSITVITDEAGAIAEALSYDPHGKRRNIDWSDALAQLQSFETKRSFTGHLYLDDVGLINMGGRYYDPELGRFLSADPFIQEPANAQSLNRYSYVLNNPLSYTDPSGFFFSKLFKAIGKAIKAVMNFIKDNIRTILAIAAAVVGNAICGPACGGFAAGMVSSGGDLKAGIIGAITGYAFSQLHFLPKTTFADQFIRVVAHGVVGGISQQIGGGDFLSGFLSAGFTQTFSLAGGFELLGGAEPGTAAFGGFDYVHNAAIAAVVGGTAAVLGGGKFKNGAITGAFSRLFNDLYVITTRGPSHVGIYVSDGQGNKAIYDPGGDYVPSTINPEGRYTGIWYGEEADLADYLKYQRSTSDEVRVYYFKTTQAEDLALIGTITNLVDNQYNTPLYCATECRMAIGSIMRFNEILPNRYFPSRPSKLESDLLDLQKKFNK